MDLFFTSDQNYKLIQQLYPVYQYQVNVGSSSHHQNAQNFNFSVEKLDNVVQLRLCNVDNQNKMFLTTIGECAIIVLYVLSVT